MRLTAFVDGGGVQMAVVHGQRAEPICSLDEFYADVPAGLERASRLADRSLDLAGLEQVPAVPMTAKVLCVGLNYRAHAAEGNRELPEHPNIFARWATNLVADGEWVPLPIGEPQLDFEGELVVIIGEEVRGVSADRSGRAIFGYACGNDITARQYQRRTPQWALGKNPDRSGGLGTIVTADELRPGGFGERAITTRLNGEVMQSSKLGMMVFSPEEIIEYASGCVTLRPGDLIYTGTPEGVGFYRNPQVLMGDGDVVEVDIEGVGVLTNRIVADRR